MRESLKSLYRELELERSPYLDRARECSRLTLSYLYREEGENGFQDLYQAYQAATAQGLQELASKLTLTLFPVDTSFFRFQLDLDPEDEAAAGNSQDLQAALADAEQTVVEEINASGARVALGQAILYLLCGGSVLLDFENKPRLHKLDQFVWKRDGAGDYFDIVVFEEKDYRTLQREFADNEEFLALLDGAFKEETKHHERVVELYTRYWINGDGDWERYQEFEGDAEEDPRTDEERVIPDSQEVYARPEELPVLPQTFIDVPGEPYGHGYVEVGLGDLRTLEGLYQALAEYSAVASQVRFGVRPGGLTRFQDIVEAENGGFFPGREEDIFGLTTDKTQDMSWTQATADRIEGRLARFFLRTSSVQRDGERVTAEEVRLMAEDLEQALGGAYSMLASRMQLPLVELFVLRLVETKKLPPLLAREETRPVVIAGLEALGRSHKLQKLSTALGLLVSTMGEQGLAFVKGRAIASEVFTASGLASEELVKTEQELQAELQQAQAAQAAEAAVPIAAQAGADAATTQTA